MTRLELEIGGLYNWKGQPERLTYLGPMVDISGMWHQFAKLDEPAKVWCEVRTYDLDKLEKTAEVGINGLTEAETNATMSVQGLSGMRGFGEILGTKRQEAMALYTPPFKYQHGYIFDNQNLMVSDNGGIGDDLSVEGAVAARVRGWGRLGYMPNGKELQDEVGQMMADALNAYYAAAQMKPA